MQKQEFAFHKSPQLGERTLQDCHTQSLRRRSLPCTLHPDMGALEQAVIRRPKARNLRYGPGDCSERGMHESLGGWAGRPLTANDWRRELASSNAHCTSSPCRPWWHTILSECATRGSVLRSGAAGSQIFPCTKRSTKEVRSSTSAPATTSQCSDASSIALVDGASAA
eukprot:scaffold125655_cov33-Tisochrysis_lutea.AAC.7